jgi:hypothetical protein
MFSVISVRVNIVEDTVFVIQIECSNHNIVFLFASRSRLKARANRDCIIGDKIRLK